jgi:hypothetical protein
MLLIHLPGGYPGEEFWSEEGAVGEGDGADESEGLSDTAVEVDGSTTADLDANLAPDQPAAQLAPGQDHGPAPTTDVCGVWWNRPFADLVPPPIEIRRELSPTPETARVGIWYFGGRMGRYGPRGV